MGEANAKAPTIVGRYVLHGELASGGMASVHLGQISGPAGFSRTVAIKRLHPHHAKDPDFVAMFLDEARLAARIQHPNVVSIEDVFSTNGELFLVMELVQGETLANLFRAARARRETIPPPIVASIIAGTLRGLHAAHEAKDDRGEPLGIIHRDVSPQNVLVSVDGNARVLDFGIAKATIRLQTTREGYVKGKLAYMAPEQITNDVLTPQTDIYAAGILLWEALTGRKLADKAGDGGLGSTALLESITPPSTLVPDLPTAFDTIALKALERDPRRRYATARDMAIALKRSVEMAMPTMVGDWVRIIARDSIAERAERIAQIENAAPARAQASSPPSVPPPAPAPTSKTPEAPAARVRRKILVIDDSEVMLERIRAALEADGHEVLATSHAVGNARHIPTCDLAIIDFHMPGIDGGTVIESLRGAATSSAQQGSSGARAATPCEFYLYTNDPKIALAYKTLGFDGTFTDKGNEEALVRQVRALFRTLHVRAIARQSKGK